MRLDPPDDAELVSDTLSGDSEAFGQLHDRYARLVRAVVVGVSGDWTAVDDMVQESFLRAYRKLATLHSPERFGPWISGIARHVGRERRRALRRDRHEYREPRILAVESSLDANAAVDLQDQLELVMRRMSDLKERERVAVHAYFLEQRDARKVAELLGMSRSGFHALIQRAIARLAIATQQCGPRQKEDDQ